MQQLIDAQGRKIEYLRVSVTDRCNYRCIYCMPPKGQGNIPHAEILSYEELLRLCRLMASMGVSRYKVTGGEPLCRKGVVGFIRSLKGLPGVEQTTLTTNGALLGPVVDPLADLGVDGINVSLDTLSQDRYAGMTRGGGEIATVLQAMAAAKARGIRVKVNVVPLMGRNEKDLLDLARFSLERGYHICFIELMPVGRGALYQGVPQEAVRKMLEQAFGPLEPLNRRIGNGPAEYFSVSGLDAGVGFISAVSKKFCSSCNRIRLTSSGFLKTCLHHNIGVDLKPFLRSGATDDDLARLIRDAVDKKPLAHEFDSPTLLEKRPERFYMNSVGG